MSRPCLPGARAAAVLRPQQQPCRLGGADLGAELSAKSPSRQRRAQELDASNDGAKIRVQILKSYLQGHICEFFFKKKLKNKKFGVECVFFFPKHLKKSVQRGFFTHQLSSRTEEK